MKIKRFFRVMIILILVLGLIMVGSMTLFAKTVTLKVAFTSPAGSNTGLFNAKFKELVEEKSNGQIIIEVYPHGQLGSLDELINGIKMGTIEMVTTDFSGFASLYEPLAVFQFPYIYRDLRHADKITSPGSPILDRINEEFIEKAGVRIIGNFLYGTRHLTCDSPIYKPEDLKGKKIRVVPVPIWIAMMEGMGGIPTPVDFSELPTALATGMVAGQENPLATIYSKKIHQVQKYLMLTGHMHSFNPVCINEKVWQGLTDLQRLILIRSQREAKEFMVDKILANEEVLLKKLEEEGMTIIGPEQGLDQEAFKSSVLAHCKEKFPQFADYIDEITGTK